MAELLSITPEQVVGHLVRIWAYADQQGINVDGSEDVVVDVAPSTLELVARLPGICQALSEVAWLRCGDRKCTFPGLSGFISESAKLRALRNRRQSTWRAAKTPAKEAVRKSTPRAQKSVTKPKPKINGAEDPSRFSPAAIMALGIRLGIEARTGESQDSFRARVLAENERRHSDK